MIWVNFFFLLRINGILLIDRENLLKFKAEGREFSKLFEITRTICSNSESSEQFLVTERFIDLFLDVSQV
jgi:hypothetical protein